MKVNVDAHVGANRVVGLGVVIRDSCGGLLVTAAMRMNVAWDARTAEAAAARYGVMVARRFGFTNVCLEGDLLSVISSLYSKHLGFAPIFSLFSNVITLSEVFNVVSYCHVRRAGNTVAHLMAR